MKSILSIALGIAALWITASVAEHAREIHKDTHALKTPLHHGVHEINNATDDNDDEESSDVRPPVLENMFNTTSTATSVSPDRTTSSLLESSEILDELNRVLGQSPVTEMVTQITKQSIVSKTDASSLEDNGPKITKIMSSNSSPRSTAGHHSTVNSSSAADTSTNATSNSVTSAPDVVQPTKGTKTYIDTIFKQSLAWLGDTYTLSLVLPVLAGFLFAIVIIISLLTFACIRTRCRRRRLRRKLLPDAIRKMGPSDRARLLAETSDEEF